MLKLSGRGGTVSIIIVSLIMVLLNADCGGGGGGGDVDDTSDLDFGIYKFFINLDLDADNATPLRIEAGGEVGSDFLLTYLGVPRPLGDEFIGAMEIAEENDEVFISSITVENTTTFGINATDIWENTNLTIEVTDTIVFEDGDDPSSGSFTMSNGTDTISVTFYKNGDAFMVNFNGAADPVALDDFKDYLENTTVSDLQKQASVAYHMMELLFDQVNFIAGIIVRIESEELGTESGDAHTGLPDPTGGTFTLNCTSGNVEPGADFSVMFDNYWKDDPDDDIDTLIDGNVNLMGFFRTETNDKLTEIGFAWGENAGVFYDETGLTLYETEDTGSVFTQERTHTIFGSYGIMFLKQ